MEGLIHGGAYFRNFTVFMKGANLMQSPTPFVFALVSLNDPHRFSTILVFISTLKYPITDVSLKTLLTVLM